MFEKFFSFIEIFIGRLGLTAVTGTAAAAAAGIATKKITEEGVVALNPLAIAGAGVAGVVLVEGTRFFATDADKLRAEVLLRQGIDLEAMRREGALSDRIASAEAAILAAANASTEATAEAAAEAVREAAGNQVKALLRVEGEVKNLAEIWNQALAAAAKAQAEAAASAVEAQAQAQAQVDATEPPPVPARVPMRKKA